MVIIVTMGLVASILLFLFELRRPAGTSAAALKRYQTFVMAGAASTVVFASAPVTGDTRHPEVDALFVKWDGRFGTAIE